MSQQLADPQGAQCEGFDLRTRVRCTSTKTKLYQLPGAPPGLQKRWFCQIDGVKNSPTGGGIWNPETERLEKVVSWDESDIIVEKLPEQSEVKITKKKPVTVIPKPVETVPAKPVKSKAAKLTATT